MGLVGWEKGVHHHLSHHRHNRDVLTLGPQGGGEGLLDVVADIPLAHSPAHVKGHGGRHVTGGLAGQEDAPHLGAVSVDDGQFIPGHRQLGQLRGGALEHLMLRLGGGGELLVLQGVAPQGHHHFGGPPHRVATRMARMACIRFSASSNTTE